MTVKKRILLVSNGFYPEISPRSYRATELAKEFCRKGHDVTVITKKRDFDYSEFLKDNLLVLKMWNKSILKDVPCSHIKPFSYILRAIKRSLLLMFEYPAIEDMFKVKKMLNSESGYDLMISFAVPYPVHWGVAWARSENHMIAGTWVADCGDPYMGDVLDSFRKMFYFKYLEKWFCRKADFITIPIPGALDGYYPEFHSKIRIISQGFDFVLSKKLGEEPKNDIPSFAYTGGFLAGARDPRPFLDELKKVETPFRFVVYTNMPDMLNKYREALNERLVISSYIPRETLLNIIKKMDFLVNFDNNTTLNSPSKLIDYIISGRPVLNVGKDFDGQKLLAFLKGDYSSRMVLPDPEQFHISTIAGRFLELLKSETL